MMNDLTAPGRENEGEQTHNGNESETEKNSAVLMLIDQSINQLSTWKTAQLEYSPDYSGPRIDNGVRRV